MQSEHKTFSKRGEGEEEEMGQWSETILS